MLDGKKTYFVGAIVALWNLGCAFVPGLAPFQDAVTGILAGLGLVTLRSGVKKAAPKAK